MNMRDQHLKNIKIQNEHSSSYRLEVNQTWTRTWIGHKSTDPLDVPIMYTSNDVHPCLSAVRLSSSIPKQPSRTKSSRYCSSRTRNKHLFVIYTKKQRYHQAQMYLKYNKRRVFNQMMLSANLYQSFSLSQNTNHY